VPNEPEDLGIKIGTKEEAFWTKVERESLDTIENLGRQIIIHQAIVELAGQKIREEKNIPSEIG